MDGEAEAGLLFGLRGELGAVGCCRVGDSGLRLSVLRLGEPSFTGEGGLPERGGEALSGRDAAGRACGAALQGLVEAADDGLL